MLKDKQFHEREEQGKIALDILEEKKIKEISNIIERRIFNCDIQGMIPQTTFDKIAEEIINLLEKNAN